MDPKRFRQVLGRVPTPVTVVASTTETGPVGMLVGSFTSVSLDPPYVGFFAGHGSTTWPAIRGAGAFCVNVLAAGQRQLLDAFSREGTERFEDVEWEAGVTGSPVLSGVVAAIDCQLAEVVRAGDHDLVVGRVVDLRPLAEDAPMVFYGGEYGVVSL